MWRGIWKILQNFLGTKQGLLLRRVSAFRRPARQKTTAVSRRASFAGNGIGNVNRMARARLVGLDATAHACATQSKPDLYPANPSPGVCVCVRVWWAGDCMQLPDWNGSRRVRFPAWTRLGTPSPLDSPRPEQAKAQTFFSSALFVSVCKLQILHFSLHINNKNKR